MKLNPTLYAFNVDNIIETQPVERLDIIDEIQSKNQEKRQANEDLVTITSQMSKFMLESKGKKPRSEMNDPVNEIVNLLGCDSKRASQYLMKYKTVDKVYSGFMKEKAMVEEFVKRYRVRPEEAAFYLESSDYDPAQAIALMNINR